MHLLAPKLSSFLQFEEKSVNVKRFYALCIYMSKTLKKSHKMSYVPSPDLLSERRTFFQDLRIIDLKFLLKEFQFVMSLKDKYSLLYRAHSQ